MAPYIRPGTAEIELWVSGPSPERTSGHAHIVLVLTPAQVRGLSDPERAQEVADEIAACCQVVLENAQDAAALDPGTG